MNKSTNETLQNIENSNTITVFEEIYFREENFEFQDN